MVACIFCGSKDTRPSQSSTLDARATRIRRALRLQRVYRCRSCDALFDATVLTVGKVRGRGAKSPKAVASRIYLPEPAPDRSEVG